MTNININIPDDLHKKAKIESVRKGKTLIEYVISAIEDKVKKA